MAYQQGGRTARIQGADLDRSRALRSTADKDFHELAAMIGRSLGEETGDSRLGGALIKFDNDKVIIETHGKCWVLEDPPGLSRECTEAERTGMVQCLAPAPDVILEG